MPRLQNKRQNTTGERMVEEIIITNYTLFILIFPFIVVSILATLLFKRKLSGKQYLLAGLIIISLMIFTHLYVNTYSTDKATIFCESNGYQLETIAIDEGSCFQSTNSTITRVNIEYINGQWYFIQQQVKE